MKKLLLFLALAGPFTFLNAQQLPNSDFDSLCVCAIDRIWDWVTPEGFQVVQDTARPMEPNKRYGPPDYGLHMAFTKVQVNYNEPDTNHLTSVRINNEGGIVRPDGSPFVSFLTNGLIMVTDSTGFPDFRQGGSPFAFRPASFTGSYKFQDSLSAVDDYGRVDILLRKRNATTGEIDTIGFASSTTELGPTSVWADFDIPITYISQDVPDTAVVVFYGAVQGSAATTLWLDDLLFSYSSTSTEEELRDSGIRMYPNPTSSRVIFDNYRLGARYELYTIRGELLLAGQLETEVNIEELPNGLYLIKIEGKEGVKQTFRIEKRE